MNGCHYDALRILFPASDGEGAHLVDMAARGQSGECSCQHFTFRVAPALDRGEIQPHTDAARCIHICRARGMVADLVIREIFKRSERRKAA